MITEVQDIGIKASAGKTRSPVRQAVIDRLIRMDESETFTTIAVEFGITRERIRQIAKRVGITASFYRTPRRQRDLDISTYREYQKFKERYPDIAEHVRVDEVLSRKRFRTAEKIVFVSAMHRSLAIPDHRIVMASKKTPLSDFMVFYETGNCLILPPGKWRNGMNTTFALNPVLRGIKHTRHDWREYINAWHLLTED